MHISWQDLLFSACGLSILSTIICTLSTVTCSIHIFSLDLVHLVSAGKTQFPPECFIHVMCAQNCCIPGFYLKTTTALAHYICMSFAIPCLAGPTSFTFSEPRMHHPSGRLPDQHHGLWGVCPTHSPTPLLSSWVHLQLWNWCSEVTHQVLN